MSKNSFYDIVNTSTQTYFYNKSAVFPEGNLEITSMWYAGGVPVAGDVRGTGLGISGQVLYANSTGALVYPSGATCYLSRIQRAGPNTQQSNMVILYDRLWQATGFSTTSSTQFFTSVPWPARDDSGLASGYGVYIALEVNTAIANPVFITGMTITYTDTDGNVDRIGRIKYFPTTAQQGSFVPFALSDGSRGVKQVDTLTLAYTGIPANSVTLVAYRPIAVVHSMANSEPHSYFDLPATKIYSNSCLSFLVAGAASFSNVSIALNFVRD